MNDEERRVAELIRDAFRDVKLGDGVGLREGRGLDDYADAKTMAKYRALDERVDWIRISSEDLNDFAYSISFLDPPGIRFHLPAFLITELKGTLHRDILFYLTDVEENATSGFDILSPSQRRAVREFLSLQCDTLGYTLPGGEANPIVKSIAEALQGYWRE